MATLKSFVRKNRANLLIKVGSTFDGMSDCVRQTGDDTFTPALDSDRVFSNNLGIAGVWCVGGSRDYLTAINENGVQGIRVSNCCGSFTVAVRTDQQQSA
jgi:hypothetical protein